MSQPLPGGNPSPRNSPVASSNPFAGGQNPFAETQNPYAAPREDGYFPAQAVSSDPFAGLWSHGDMLVMHKLAPLPDICLKSNLPATRRLKRSLSWHHPGFYLLFLLNWLIYLVVALIIRKTAIIHIPLTDEWYFRRRRRMLIAWSLVLLSILLFFLAIPFMDQQPWAPFLLIGSIILVLGSAIWGLVACRMVWPKRMTDQYIWLKGVDPDYLRRLEVWQWNI